MLPSELNASRKKSQDSEIQSRPQASPLRSARVWGSDALPVLGPSSAVARCQPAETHPPLAGAFTTPGAPLSHRKRRFLPQLSRKKQFALILNGACWHRELALHFPWAVTLLGFVLLSRNRCALLALVHQGPVFSTSPRNTIVIQSCIFKQVDLLGCVMDGVSGCLVLGFVVIPVRF